MNGATPWFREMHIFRPENKFFTENFFLGTESAEMYGFFALSIEKKQGGFLGAIFPLNATSYAENLMSWGSWRIWG